MIKRNRLHIIFTVLSLTLLVLIVSTAPASEDAAVSHTRDQVDMLDTLYKSTIVLITDKYVSDPSKYSGASAAKALFSTMKEKGFHEVRLVGLTDTLINLSLIHI